MSDHITEKQDDVWLIKLFKNPEIILSSEKSDIDWSTTIDFQVFSEFLVSDIKEMQERLKNADHEYFYYVCRHTFNIMDWIRLIVDAGFSTFDDAFEQLFDKHFGDKNILQSMYDACFERWISQSRGQQKIGENFYNVLDDNIYYRNRFGQWFNVDRTTAFDLKSNKERINDGNTIDQLNSEYKETWYDAILRRWEDKHYRGVLPDDFLKFDDKETSPEAYFDFTIARIKTLLKNPVSVVELDRWNGDEIVDLESMIKISALVLDMTAKRRSDDSHTLYLLRDCLMFYEAHKIIDILNSEDTSADQILIGRKLLSYELRDWGYYVVTLQALYNAHKHYPANFTEFYNEYARLLDMFVSLNSGFAAVIANLADYIKEHVRTDKNKIVVFDIGFQGSIALLSKYVIDRHIRPSHSSGNIETDVKIGVGAEWSKKLFGDRHENDYFPFLNRVQLAARSDELYHYKLDSLHSGKLQVVMGDKKWQHKAAIELVVLVMVALLEH
ncbi:MAG: hypothetical protein HZA36_03900 [Parcubacteria group bacterium]|nr:hypothetical protein [Parcubacteria group bacterium]